MLAQGGSYPVDRAVDVFQRYVADVAVFSRGELITSAVIRLNDVGDTLLGKSCCKVAIVGPGCVVQFDADGKDCHLNGSYRQY